MYDPRHDLLRVRGGIEGEQGCLWAKVGLTDSELYPFRVLSCAGCRRHRPLGEAT